MVLRPGYALAAALFACSETAPPPVARSVVRADARSDVGWDGSPVRTDSLVYQLRKFPGIFQASASAIYVNRSGGPVYFRRCDHDAEGPMYGLRRTGPDSTARKFIGGFWGCVGGVPAGVVPPGDSLSFRVWLGSTESPRARPPITPEQRVGRFRVMLELCSEATEDSDACMLLPIPERQSNAFEVRFAEEP